MAKNFTVISGGKQKKAPRFVFKLESEGDNGKTYSLPALQDLPIKTLRLLSKVGSTSDGIDEMIKVLDRYCPGLTDKISGSELTTILNAWAESSTVTVGE